jgi:cytochrome b subunit of formate dehydrogenase
MNGHPRIRQFHRWLSIAFTLAVIVNCVAWARHSQATWVGLLALVPLALLMITGLYMFFAPYAAKRRRTGSLRAGAR